MPEELRQEAESQGAASRKVAEGVREIAEAFGGFPTADGGTLLEALKLHHQGIDTAGDRQEKKDRRKDILGGIQVVCGTVALVLIVFMAIFYSPDAKRADTIEKILTALLPAGAGALGYLVGQKNPKKE